MYARFCILEHSNLSSFPSSGLHSLFTFPTVLILVTASIAVAQSSTPGSMTPPTTPPSATAQSSPATQNGAAAPISVTPATAAIVQATSAEDVPPVNPVLSKIERARALAAAHQLQQAATDLENVRASANDVALKNVTTLMLIGIYLEEGNYGRAQALLEEAFLSRAFQKDESLRTYFAMAGQTINGVRSHLARYRSFGLNPSDQALPAEANTDLDRVRNLLERVAAQAREIGNEVGRSYDAVALQEDVVGIRLSLARDDSDRDKWQAEYVAVRERLASSQAQTTSVGRSALFDAVTARIPNPFSTKSTEGNTTSPNAPALTTDATKTAEATEKSAPQLISVGSLNGREIKRVTPTYPSVARTAGVFGTVRVFAIVDENGKVWVTNSEGPTLLRKAAEEAARNWSFPPTLVSSKPARIAGYLDFEFKQ